MKDCILDISFQEYIDDPCEDGPSLSRSTIHQLITETPAHVFHDSKRLNPDYVEKEQDKKFDIGTSGHDMLLGGGDAIEIVDAADWKTKVAKEAREEAREAGKTPLLTHQAEKVTVMVSAVLRQILNCPDLGIADLASEGKSEQTYMFKSGETWCRVRTDWTKNDGGLILDLKFTGESAHPDAFAKKVLSYAYDVQEQLYCDGVGKLHNTEPHFIFIVAETTAPYMTSFISLDHEFMEMGEQKIRYGKQLWNTCLKSGKWPGYPNHVACTEPPGWGMASWEMKKYEIDNQIEEMKKGER